MTVSETNDSRLAVVAIVFVIGTVLGITSGYIGGALDHVLMRVTLIFQAFPSFILAVAVAGILGNGMGNSILSLCAVYWTTYARLARSLTVSMRNAPYIKAAKVCGANRLVGLSFLGLGAVRPTAEWGAVMSEAKDYLQKAPWIIVFNGIALFLVVTVFNLLGDSLRDALDTKGEI